MKHCFQLIVFSCSVRRNVHSFLSQPNNANGRLVMGRSARNAVRWRREMASTLSSLWMWCSRKCWTTCANWFRSIVIEISRKIYGSKLWLTCSQLYCVVFYVSPFCPHLLSIEVPQTEHWLEATTRSLQLNVCAGGVAVVDVLIELPFYPLASSDRSWMAVESNIVGFVSPRRRGEGRSLWLILRREEPPSEPTNRKHWNGIDFVVVGIMYY